MAQFTRKETRKSGVMNSERLDQYLAPIGRSNDLIHSGRNYTFYVVSKDNVSGCRTSKIYHPMPFSLGASFLIPSRAGD